MSDFQFKPFIATSMLICAVSVLSGCNKFSSKPVGLSNGSIFGANTAASTQSPNPAPPVVLNGTGPATTTETKESASMFKVPAYRVYSEMAISYNQISGHVTMAKGFGYKVYSITTVEGTTTLKEQPLKKQDYVANKSNLIASKQLAFDVSGLPQGDYIFLICADNKMESPACNAEVYSYSPYGNNTVIAYGKDTMGPFLWRQLAEYRYGSTFPVSEAPGFQITASGIKGVNLTGQKANVWGPDTAPHDITFSGFPIYFDFGKITRGYPTPASSVECTSDNPTSCEQPPTSTCSPEDPTCGQESPLIIDLGNDLAHASVELSSQAKGVEFDIRNDGSKVRISWPVNPAKDMFLALPNDGKITSSEQLFGNQTIGADGKKTSNGFLALSEYASADHPNVIDTRDKIYSELRLWSDLNRDGVAQASELFTLAEKNVKAIHLDYLEMDATDIYGNSSRQRSYVDMGDASQRMIFDVWFNVRGQ